MTLEDVKKEVDLIRQTSSDEEKAHGREDDLYRDVLEEVARRCVGEIAEMAREALSTKEIGFGRHCA